MKQQEQLQQAIEEMQAAGMSNDQIRMFMGKVQAAGQVRAEAMAPSQSDRVEIRQSEGNVPGVYVDSGQVAQDLYADSVARGQQITSPQTQGLVGGPPRAGAVDITMGNPQYQVVQDGQRTTVNANGDIVRY